MDQVQSPARIVSGVLHCHEVLFDGFAERAERGTFWATLNFRNFACLDKEVSGERFLGDARCRGNALVMVLGHDCALPLSLSLTLGRYNFELFLICLARTFSTVNAVHTYISCL